MGTIKQIHNGVVKNDVEGFLEKIADPVSPVILCSKDMNGLNVLHKAAGLGYMDIAREILERYPAAALAQDNDGKTPLHYGAAVRDGGAMYELLAEYGADESKLDNRNKAAAFYKNRPGDIDLSNLVVIPEAPRVSGTKYPKHWDWRILDSDGMSLRSLKKIDTQVDVDSAFGSAESALKSAASSENVFGEEQPENDDNDEGEEEEAGAGGEEEEAPADEEEEEAPAEGEEEAPAEGDDEEPAAEGEAEEAAAEGEEEAAAADEEGEAPAEGEDEETAAEAEEEAPAEGEEEEAVAEEEEPAADDDADVEEADAEPGDEDEEKPEDADSGNIEPIDEENQDDEKNERSTGDSGVDESRVEDDQVIAGEHEEEIEGDFNDVDIIEDPEIDHLLVNGNMEQLASVVLNGEGRRLVNRQSSNPELQAFIDNVPSYIGKIHAVHIAAREGNLRDLQNALDRRKFAIARDGASPHGATPLHVAVVFGHTSVIRYLAGRFPETTHAVDVDGRTPLHYAATLADNGHYYNLLLHLGANPLILDNFGQKADFYKENQTDLSHKQLLRDFGAREELADEMLTDKEHSNMETPIFREEEGRYLASSVGDPLIKGLAKVAQSRPKDPLTYLATYLYNFARNKSGASIQKSDILIVPDRPEEEIDLDSSSTPMEDPHNTPDDESYLRSPASDVPESAFSPANRDEHGQSMLHFACVRTRPKDGLFHILQETQINLGYRDELYRTARDVAEESNFQENVADIDRYVVYLAARGETEKLVELLLEGYDHILDTEDGGVNVVDITAERNHEATIQFLQGIPTYIGQREEVHRAIRGGDLNATKEILSRYGGGGTLLAVGKNTVGRCSMHIAVLCEHIDIVRYLANTYPETLRIGDNLNRTALHYAMGVHGVEEISGILIKAGAKRVQKDLKSRQPTYYFMNKSDIQRLQEEEKTLVK
uniref:Slc24a1 protein n=1 Tax=Fopius arisanus TaxID=64838 RepID=A0A0C9RYC7_9HYME